MNIIDAGQLVLYLNSTKHADGTYIFNEVRRWYLYIYNEVRRWYLYINIIDQHVDRCLIIFEITKQARSRYLIILMNLNIHPIFEFNEAST